MKWRRDMFFGGWILFSLLATVLPAGASNCWRVTGWLDPANQSSNGQIGDHADLVTEPCVSPAPAGYGWLHPMLPNSGYSGTIPSDLYVLISLSDSHVVSGLFTPRLFYNGMMNSLPILVVNATTCIACNNTMSFVTQPGPCTRSVTWWTGSLQASYDGANCYVNPVPPSASAFIYNNNFYVAAVQSTTCQVGSYDGANCFVMALPNGGFIYNNGFYATAGTGQSCSVGTFDGANCFIQSVPPGSQAFIFGNAFYATPLKCAVGRYDGANCYLGSPPSVFTATIAFIYAGGFYYHE